MSDIAKISPSCIRDYLDYRDGKTCGYYFRYKWIDRIEVDEEKTGVQLFGYRFEYLVTNELPYRVTEPPSELLTAAGNRSKADNAKVEAQAELCIKALKREGFEIVETSPIMEHVYGSYRLKQVNDIYAIKDGVNCFIDLKTSGLLYNKWEDFGWDVERLHLKTNLLIQPAVAKLLAQDCMHVEDIPFYFYIGSNTNNEDAEIFEIVFDKKRFAGFLDIIEDVGTSIFFEQDLGFTPRPSYKECRSCKYNKICKLAIDTPKIKKIIISV